MLIIMVAFNDSNFKHFSFDFCLVNKKIIIIIFKGPVATFSWSPSNMHKYFACSGESAKVSVYCI